MIVNRGVWVTLAVCAWLNGCATSPTGRSQLLLYPESEMTQMGLTAYEQIKQETPIAKDSATNRYVNCVAKALIKEASPRSGARSNWEVTVFKDDAANAFALPGGKIGVNTGLLKLAKNQDQLAAVIGHEIGHVEAQHANARVSAAMATSLGLQTAQVVAGVATPEYQQLVGLLGVGAQYGILMPYNRGQESEADYLGLELMAKAGFDPRESVQLWRNMAKASPGAPPEFLSTHPASSTRIRQLEADMAAVMPLYENARRQGRIPNCK